MQDFYNTAVNVTANEYYILNLNYKKCPYALLANAVEVNIKKKTCKSNDYYNSTLNN